jgi:nitrite reductase/ring-hydroxylating ferredoxin subunit
MPPVVACEENAVKNGRGTKITVDGQEIALFRSDGRICAVSNMCPHQKFQKLHEGMYENGIVTCPMHGWAYDVRTGISMNASGKLTVFPASVQNGKVVLEIE